MWLRAPNGANRLYFAPWLIRFEPQAVVGSDGLTYVAARDSIWTISRQVVTATVTYQAQQASFGTISGRVTGNGYGIGDATVTLTGDASAIAAPGDGGFYSFTDLVAGTYTLTVSTSFPGITFPEPTQTVTLAAGQSLTVNLAGSY